VNFGEYFMKGIIYNGFDLRKQQENAPITFILKILKLIKLNIFQDGISQ